MQDLSRRRLVGIGTIGLLASTLPRPVSAQEPVSTLAAVSFVGIALLQGAISYVGGQLAAAALGSATISDVQAWIHAAVAEIEAFVSAELRRQLDEKVIEQIRADLQGVITNLNEYASLMPKNLKQNRYLIHDSDTMTSRLLPLSLNYDQAFFISTAIMAYRLFTMQFLYLADRDKGHIAHDGQGVKDCLKSLTASRDRISQRMSPEAHVTSSCSIAYGKYRDCVVYQDGVIIPGSFRRDPDRFYDCHRPAQCERGMDASEAAIEKLATSYYGPFVKQQSAFLTYANASIALISEGYGKLCKEAGVAHVGPTLATHLPKPVLVEPLLLPGASVNRI